MAQSTKPPISSNYFEHEIKEELKNRPPFRLPQAADLTPPIVGAPAMAMPDYVEHRDGATEIGKLSAEAVVREYEAAAKEIEAMGTELMELVKLCEANTSNALSVSEELKETAARYRDEAKRVFLQIEACSLVTAEVRKTCIELMNKITRPGTVDHGNKSKKK
jgi:hypothetical protein